MSKGLYVNDKLVAAIGLSGKVVTSIYDVDAGKEIWSKGGEPVVDYSTIPMYFENVDTNPVRLSLVHYGSTNVIEKLNYSLDNNTWKSWINDYPTEDTYIDIPVGGKVYLRNPYNDGRRGLQSTSYYNYFATDGKVSVAGNFMSLCYKDFIGKTTFSSYYCEAVGYNLFKGVKEKLIDVSNFVLPATTLPNNCYFGMFLGCTSLTTSPNMSGVTSLGEGSMQQMFYGCTSLKTAPDLSSITTIGNSGMFNMFRECSSLTTAPDISNLTSIGNAGISSMYRYCTSLNYAIAPSVSSWNINYSNNWLDGVAATGVVQKPASLTIPTGYYGVPSGWTTVDR